ncbi:dienelactone hydrolase family protein [Variovorax sp. J22P168]|uniref:dienelactone hydrolase family protein n=1 Tax=Variovorax jilinensis TaxID=3053513 RepID=UPI002577DE90|nr:dienelactone hydrolase family protein [Variovorax sp. J22P168]MDM0015510.1 dienelactone hydrolase family protein [Variovorax sp. J22P168]
MATMSIATPDGNFAAYIARPRNSPAPVVVACQEIFGINADMRQTCDELAATGFIALCPDLFWRQEPGVELSHLNDWPRALALYKAFDLDAGVRDVASAVDAGRSLEGATGKVGVMGYCLGGLLTFLVAARSNVDAAVAYYGGRTEEFLAEAGAVKAPMLMHLGEEDEFISKPAQQAIASAFAGKPQVEVYRYAGCMHAFARHGGTHYDASAADLANGRTFDFLQSRLHA